MVQRMIAHSQRRPKFTEDRICRDGRGIQHLFSLAQIPVGAQLTGVIQGSDNNKNGVDANPPRPLDEAVTGQSKKPPSPTGSTRLPAGPTRCDLDRVATAAGSEDS